MHPKFRILKNNIDGAYERAVIQEWVDGMVDRDHNMIEKFQKEFHSCFWEFYLYACFKEAGFVLDQTHNRPDFIITSPCEMNVEAVVANIKQGGRPESERNEHDLMNMFVPPWKQNDFYQIQDEAITRQSNAVMSKIKKYDEYSKCKWVNPDVPFLIAVSSYSQVNYGKEYIYPMITLLYGLYYTPYLDGYKTVNEITKPGTNSKIPVGLFRTDRFKHVSAILYSCTTTLGKVDSISISNGNYSCNTVYNMIHDYEDDRLPYKIQEVSPDCPEELTDGLFLFHNPFAENKLDPNAFNNMNVVQIFFENGQLMQMGAMYSLVCRLNVPKVLDEAYFNLIYEYCRQYNRIPPIEFYNLNSKEEVRVDFRENCLVCIWVYTTPDKLHIRNVYYERSNTLDDAFLKKEAVREIQRISNEVRADIYGIRGIQIIRSEEVLDYVNQV